ncbi:MAG: tripartite tricarboxylate transporter TctB family protein [Paracoccaceae bacterium]
MDDKARQTIADLALAGLTLAGAVILFIGAVSLPPPRFEPLGSAALPRILGGLLVVFALIVAVGAIMRHRSSDPIVQEDKTGPKADPKRGALVFVALIAYVFALDVLSVPFLVATPLFVIAMGMAIIGISWRGLISFAVLGLVLAIFISTVLERLLYIRIG